MNDDGTLSLGLLPSRTEMEQAFATRDPGYDGAFFVAVRTTGIFCRPSCPSRPNPANIEFLPTVRECLLAGYRPCKRCLPTHATGTPPGWAAGLMKLVAACPDGRPGPEDLRQLGVTPERARRWFRENCGMTFAGWARAHRLAAAFTRIQDGTPIDQAGYEAGFESASGFREAFVRVFGSAPGQMRKGSGPGRVVVALVESPVGPLLAAARDEGICLLEFTDGRGLDRSLAALRTASGCGVVPGEHPQLDRLRTELSGYFEGRLRRFTVPVAADGTRFQKEVWAELARVPHGETLSYEALACRLGRPAGQRAVARANAVNRVCILIPCHRVIGKDGQLTGYGGGLWRKRLLLELERTGRLPGTRTPD